MSKKEQMRALFDMKIRGGDMILSKFVVVDFDTFYDVFSGVVNIDKYEDYIAIDQGKRGYGEFLRSCKDDGILH